jgi:predicted GNAT superfamily acetyltransferase
MRLGAGSVPGHPTGVQTDADTDAETAATMVPPATPGDPAALTPALRSDARATALTAAEHADVEVEDAHTHARLREAVALFDAVWGRDTQAGSILAPEALTALAHAGGQVSIARRRTDGRVVAATAAFLGRDHAAGTVHLHSHVTGVVAGEEGRGIGRAMKWHQRAWALDRGIGEVRWTFDPLIRRNAVLNLALLGAGVRGYLVDLYGPMPDARNHGLPTDRLEASWDLAAPRVRAAAAGRIATPDVEALKGAGAAVLLDVGAAEEPVHTPTEADRRLVRIPADIEGLRRDAPELGRAWTEAVRATLGAALDAGARLTGCTRDGWYVLAEPVGLRELTDRR